MTTDQYIKYYILRKTMENEIIVERYDSPSWKFRFSKEYGGFVYVGRKHVYKLFFEDPTTTSKPFWIGQRVGEDAWVTAEKEIKARRSNFVGSHIDFNI